MMIKWNLILSLFISGLLLSCHNSEPEFPLYQMSDTPVEQVHMGGILGEQVYNSEVARLAHYIEDENSPFVQLFNKQVAIGNDKGQGEYVGKWLYAASRAAKRSGNEPLEKQVKRVANYLISQQEKNGYLGTYPDSVRFNSIDDINQKNGDVWLNAYLISGLAELCRQFGGEQYLTAAKNIGDLFIETFEQTDKQIAHAGIGALGAFVDLYELTGEQKYLDFAAEIKEKEGLELISKVISGSDASVIGNGQIYNLLRVFTGLARLYAYNGDEQLLQACEMVWENIKIDHLTPAGDPWGGIGADHHLSCFNHGNTFSPYGYVETCSTMAWFQFTSILLKITAEAKYASELEKTAYNALFVNQLQGEGRGVYHSHPDGEIEQADEAACGSSSRLIALEEIAPIMYTRYLDQVYINIFGSSSMEYAHTTGGSIRIVQDTRYPYDGFVKLKFETDDKRYVDLHIRIPEWAEKATVTVGGVKYKAVPGEYAQVTKKWKTGDVVEIILPMRPFIKEATQSVDEKGDSLIPNRNYFNIQYGALNLATSLCNTKQQPSKLAFKGQDPYPYLRFVSPPGEVPTFTFNGIRDTTLVFQPYFLVGEMEQNACRTSWISWEK